MADTHGLHWADYVVFAATVVLSLAVGVYYAVAGTRQRTTSEYLMADRSLGTIPVSISMSVSFLSAIAILGNSSEMHYYGATYMFYAAGLAVGLLLGTFCALPFLFPLKLASINQYLTHRFESKVIRLTGWLSQLIRDLLFGGLVIFGPSVMFEAMSGFPTWASMIIMGVASTSYTTMGGLKAVVWTDVFQAVVILAGLITVVIRGFILCGGMEEVWSLYDDGYRLEISADADPLSRMTVWSISLTGLWHGYYSVGIAQTGVQRAAALRSLRGAILAGVGTIPVRIALEGLSMLCGVITFAYYSKKGCDPLAAGHITNTNQILPYFVMETLNYPGIPGLFVACVFCGSLSNLSSSLTSATVLTWDDLMNERFQNWSESRRTQCTKLLTVLFGVMATAASFILSHVGGTLMQINAITVSAAICPGVIFFIAGPLIRRLNWKSVMAGAMLSAVLALTLGTGAIFFKTHQGHLPIPNESCSGNAANRSVWVTSAIIEDLVTDAPAWTTAPDPASKESSPFTKVFELSPYLHVPLLACLGIVVSIVASLLPGCHETEKRGSRLYYPCIRGCVEGKESRPGDYKMVATKPPVVEPL